MMDVNSWAQVNDYLYFKSYETCPGTFIYNMNTKALTMIDDGWKWEKFGYFRTSSVGGTVVFLPRGAGSDFCIYDTESASLFWKPKKYKNAAYRSTAVWENKLYCFPNGSHSIAEIAVFNPGTRNVEYPFEENGRTVSINAYSNAVADKEHVYLPLKDANKILRLNLNNGDCEPCSVGMREEHYGVIIRVNDLFYLSGEKPFLYLWDGCSDVQEIPLEDRSRGGRIPWKQLFSDAILLGNQLLFAPVNYSCPISLDIETQNVQYVNLRFGMDHISWGMEQFRDSIFMSSVSVSGGQGKQYLLSVADGGIRAEEKEIVKLNEDIDLCEYGVEYSEHALPLYIRKVIENI